MSQNEPILAVEGLQVNYGRVDLRGRGVLLSSFTTGRIIERNAASSARSPRGGRGAGGCGPPGLGSSTRGCT